jgi:GNAT superfamily N-acetyltransferase
VSRSPVVTRVALPVDVPQLVELLGELRAVEGRESLAVDPGWPADDVEGRLYRALADPGYRVVVATEDEVPAGMAVLATASLGPLTDERALTVSHLVVRHRFRRRGIGHALLAAAAAYADEIGLDHVLVGAYPALREANRFYARLGFAPLSVRRVAHVSTLRRRLAAPRQRSLIDDISRRRLTRAGRN